MSLPELEHHHIKYQSVSVISAVVCPKCGLFVGGDFTAEHNTFHDQLTALLPSSQPEITDTEHEHAHTNGD